MQTGYSQSIGRTCRGTETFGRFHRDQTHRGSVRIGVNSLPLTQSSADSHAKTFPMPGEVPALRENAAGCGTSSRGWLAKWDRVLLLWKTSQRCLLGDSMPFSGRWPRSGMMRNGIAFRLRPLVPSISETESSLWPTARATDGSKGSRTLEGARKELARGKNIDLGVAVKLWPTPQARDHFPAHSAEYIAKKKAEGHGMSNLNDSVGGKLNPTWVEWLMGFPLGWTDCEDLETQSSHKSLK